LRRERLVLRLEFELLLVQVPHVHVDAEHRDVQRDDAGEQGGERRDPEDAATDAETLRTAARTRTWTSLSARPRTADGRCCDIGREPVDRGHYSSAPVLIAARMRADA